MNETNTQGNLGEEMNSTQSSQTTPSQQSSQQPGSVQPGPALSVANLAEETGVTVSKADGSFSQSYPNVVRAGYELVSFDKDGNPCAEGVKGKKSQKHWATYLKSKGVRITRGRFSTLSNGSSKVTAQISGIVKDVLAQKGYSVTTK